jgi:hypothetical protein
MSTRVEPRKPRPLFFDVGFDGKETLMNEQGSLRIFL